MDLEAFQKHGHELIDWIVEYYSSLESKPVKSSVRPKAIFNQISSLPPQKPEKFESIMKDMDEKIMPGITHWQHPNFHAYFPGNSSFPSLLGEIVTSTLGAQCMIWETSPAAAELEEVVMNWLKEMMNLPKNWYGVIQDTASTATLVALISAREEKTGFEVNKNGFKDKKLRVYCSKEIHSSIEKAIKIAGFGASNLVKISVSKNMAMLPEELNKAIKTDLDRGHIPCAVVAGSGTTGTLAFDPLTEIGAICKKYKLWFHIDAAYAGTSRILEEQRQLTTGIELADSYVFNPHKWMFTNFDCTAYFVKDKEVLIRSFEILPEYLRTKTQGLVNDYRDWGIQLGRRFRALKLWFVIRTYGTEGLKARIRDHISYAKWLEANIHNHPNFELMAHSELNMVVFRYFQSELDDQELDAINEKILSSINQSGEAYITHTKVHDKYVIRIVTGQTYLEKRHVEKMWNLIELHTQMTLDQISTK